ncbi:hypothetical protein [Caballeronia sordidicola]|uniref:hypothetical protein n=1 Tax=Caballeronia sordidicola TaxID=196367 RepID=UPI0004D03C6E|nr:hypothetical protein [Caballeronia sordidicola]
MEFQAQHLLLMRGASSLLFSNRYPDIRTMCPPRPATGALDPTATFRAKQRDVFRQTIVLEDISDVSRYTLKSGRYTSFNAIVAGCEYKGMRVAGWPRLVAGMTVHAVLRRAGDFSTLEAWWDSITRKIVGLKVNRMGEAAPMLVAAVVIFAVSLVARILAVAGAGFLGGTAILFGIWARQA